MGADANAGQCADVRNRRVGLQIGKNLVSGLVTFGALMHLGAIYWIGVIAIAGTLVYEQSLVKPNDLSRIDKAFFDLNGYVSLVFAVCTIVESLR